MRSDTLRQKIIWYVNRGGAEASSLEIQDILRLIMHSFR